MVANADKSTQQCVRKLMVVIQGFLEWPKIYHGKIKSLIQNCTGECLNLRDNKIIRLRLSGHCIRHNDKLAHIIILWTPKNGILNRGRQPRTFIDILKNYCDCEK